MKGLGTNEAALIEVLGPRTNEELQLIQKTYTSEIKRDLIKDIKDETSGHFEDALVSLILTATSWTRSWSIRRSRGWELMRTC